MAMTEKEKREKKIEALRARRIEDCRTFQVGNQLEDPAFYALLVPPKSLTEDLNLSLPVSYLDHIARSSFEREQLNLAPVETIWNHDGQLAVERQGDGVLVNAVQLFHSGAIDIIVPIKTREDKSVDVQFWNDALNIASRACLSIQRFAGESRFFFACALVGMTELSTTVEGKPFGFTRPHYIFPIVEVDKEAELYEKEMRSIGTRVAHTLGRSHL